MVNDFGAKNCHLNFHDLKLLKQKYMVQELTEIQTMMDPCESFLTRKQHRNLFQRECLGEQVHFKTNHTNICIPIKTPYLEVKDTF